MKIRLHTTIIFTKDISASKAFYHGLLGLAVAHEDDTFVLLEGNLGLHRADVFYGYLEKPYNGEAMGKDNLDLYFTTDAL
jgi:catechol 2,3-dioxygenase-like lactoylglutathione lyase family enzyme